MRFRRLMQRCIPALLLTIASAAPALAAPPPVIEQLSPAGVQPGAREVELVISGRALDEVTEVALPNARGVTATLNRDALKPDRATLHLSVAADAPTGFREVRLIGPGGASNPLSLRVSAYSYQAEQQPSSPRSPQSVALPALLAGRTDEPGDRDAYRFEAKKGQTLIFDVYGERLGAKIDSVITLIDSTGHEVAASDNHHGLDSMLAYQVPTDGVYTLEIRDLEYRGGGEFAYQIEAGAIPYLQAVFPPAVQRGKSIELDAIGYNLGSAKPLRIDLDDVTNETEHMPVRAKTSAGVTNTVPLEVTELPQQPELETNDAAEHANAAAFPTVIVGRMDQPGDADYYRFTVTAKQRCDFQVAARALGSPLDALLTLYNDKGSVIERNDDGGEGADARITRELEPGEYLLGVADLTRQGGPHFTYRLSAGPLTEPRQDFTLRFMPDTPRVHRGGNTKMWAEVVREGFKGEVELKLLGAPEGVTIEPSTLAADTSGIFTITASADAPLGTAPIRIAAIGKVARKAVTRSGEPEFDQRVVEQAYLTVLEAAPFSVLPLANADESQFARSQGLAAGATIDEEIAALQKELDTPTPEQRQRQKQWQAAGGTNIAWVALDPLEFTSGVGVSMDKEAATGAIKVRTYTPAGDADVYTLFAPVNVKDITGIRLEALTMEGLPKDGPGRADNGNFHLTGIEVSVAPRSDPLGGRRLALHSPRASFVQKDTSIEATIDDDPKSGWGIDGEVGREHSALWRFKEPVTVDADSVLTVQLRFEGAAKHALGRYRLAVTTAAQPNLTMPLLTRRIEQLLAKPNKELRRAEKNQLAAFFRTIDPALDATRRRIEELKSSSNPYLEIAALKRKLDAATPELESAQREWETRAATESTWRVLSFDDAGADGGVKLVPQDDGSLLATEANPDNATYTLKTAAPIGGVRVLRLEALPDDSLPARGPGRAQNGNFVLSHLKITAKPPESDAAADVKLHDAKAEFSQANWPIENALDPDDNNGWATMPRFGQPNVATFAIKEPIAKGSVLTITLAHRSVHKQHTIGRFRISVSDDAEAGSNQGLPPEVAAILDTPREKRTPEQAQKLAAHYRTIAPLLQPMRERLTALQKNAAAFPPVVAKKQTTQLEVLLDRDGGYRGDVKLSLEGFVTGRGGNGQPNNINQSVDVKPITLKAGDVRGTIEIKPKNTSQTGARLVVLRAEGKVARETVVQYSTPFTLIVKD